MKKGILIAVSGVDGAGKTTQVELIQKYFLSKGKSIKVIKTFDYFLLTPILRLAKRSQSGTVSSSHHAKKNKNLVLKLWCMLALIDYWVIYIFNIRPLRKYDIILSDRYFLDMVIAMRVNDYMPSRLFKTYIKLIPKADIQIILRVDHRVSLDRSKEFDVVYHKLQQRLYNEAATALKIKMIDGQESKYKVMKDIISYGTN